MGAVGVVIGRFQVDEIHQGHVQLLETVRAKHERLMILLGCARSVASRDNPLNYQIRDQMLRELFPAAIILPVYDQQTDEQWSYQVDTQIMTAFPAQSAVLYGGRDSFIPHYKGRFEVRQLDFGNDPSDTSGANRRRLISQTTRNSPDFRAGVIHALNTLPAQSIPCVDIAVWRKTNGTWEVLLGRKDHERGWRLPGGHVDPTDANYTTAARRELSEEAGVICESDPIAIGSFAIDDWRTRNRTDIKYFTTLYVHQHGWGVPRAGDDLAAVQWFSLGEAEREVLPDHLPLIKAVQHYLNVTRGV